MTAAEQQPLFYNPLEPGYVEDPFPHLAEMRATDPVHHSLIQRWILFGYDDVFRLLRDPSLSVSDENADWEGSERAALFEKVLDGRQLEASTSILNVDPPDHTRLRKLVSKAFTPRTIEELRPSIQTMVDDALDAMAAAGGGDLVAELAFPLPFDVITEMLGMPSADTERIRDWSEALVKTLDPIITEEELEASLLADANMRDHIDHVIEWKRDNPGDDLLTAMIEAEDDGDRMSPRELRDQVQLLFVAGHETTVNLIGTGVYELLRHPDQYAKLHADPTLAPAAVEELLRYTAPVQFSRRIATADISFGDKDIPSGSFVMACLASANRDVEKFGPTADQLDISRPDAGQLLSFGSGAHYCLGASLAKLEAELAIGTVAARFPKARVVDAHWNGRINLRGLDRLVLEL